jgi:hypothetical protein
LIEEEKLLAREVVPIGKLDPCVFPAIPGFVRIVHDKNALIGGYAKALECWLLGGGNFTSIRGGVTALVWGVSERSRPM